MCDRNLKIDQTQNFNLGLNLVVLDLVDEPQEVTNVRVFFRVRSTSPAAGFYRHFISGC